MHDLEGVAVRRGGFIHVTLVGFLKNTCARARITDYYPGTIVHVVDPGHAEVFITETERPGACLEYLVPWTDTALLPDEEHDEVSIKVGGREVLRLRVFDALAAAAAVAEDRRGHVVIAYWFSDEPPQGCMVVPAGHGWPKLYKVVFGPDDLSACQRWLEDNCGPEALPSEG